MAGVIGCRIRTLESLQPRYEMNIYVIHFGLIHRMIGDRIQNKCLPMKCCPQLVTIVLSYETGGQRLTNILSSCRHSSNTSRLRESIQIRFCIFTLSSNNFPLHRICVCCDSFAYSLQNTVNIMPVFLVLCRSTQFLRLQPSIFFPGLRICP